MENFKSALFLIIFLVVIAVVGYWAFFTLEPGSLHAERERQAALEEENANLKEEIETLKSEIRVLSESLPPEEEPVLAEEEPSVTPASTSTYKNQTLINELEKLASDSVYMKVGSRGTRVGSVQKFLNLYNNTSKRVDNDYGAGTKADVANFQKAQGITADGETGPATYRKMIDWLKKQG